MSELSAKTISAQLKSTGALSANIISGKLSVQISAGSAGGGIIADVYDGPYEVVPEVSDQVLRTAKKYMNEDVNIQAIPYSEVSNSGNGTTVTIG